MAICHVAVRSVGPGAGASTWRYVVDDRGGVRPDLAATAWGRLPSWAPGPAEFFAEADQRERINGRVAVQLELALPKELSAEEGLELARSWADSLTEAEQLTWALAVHDDGGHNPHFHLLIHERGDDGIERDETTFFRRANRKNPERGGRAKSRSLHGKDWVLEARQSWTLEANRALEQAGRSDVSLDPRSHADRKIARIPQIHLGPHCWRERQRGRRTDRGDLYDEILEANEWLRRHPEHRWIVTGAQSPSEAAQSLREATETRKARAATKSLAEGPERAQSGLGGPPPRPRLPPPDLDL